MKLKKFIELTDADPITWLMCEANGIKTKKQVLRVHEFFKQGLAGKTWRDMVEYAKNEKTKM